MAGIKHGDASEGFSDDEEKAILECADTMTVWIRGRGSAALFMGHLMRTLMYPGVHITNFAGRKEGQRHVWDQDGKMKLDADGKPKVVLMKEIESLSSKNITESMVDGKPVKMIVIRRVKKRTKNITHIPLSSRLMPWLPEFLDQRRPGSRARYNQLLEQLGKDSGREGNADPSESASAAASLYGGPES